MTFPSREKKNLGSPNLPPRSRNPQLFTHARLKRGKKKVTLTPARREIMCVTHAKSAHAKSQSRRGEKQSLEGLILIAR